MTRHVTNARPARLRHFVAIAALSAIAVSSFVRSSHAGETNEWTTTELGITVTQAEILDAFEGCSEFWPAVCRHIEKRAVDMGTEASRSSAVDIIRKTQLELHKQFFETDETSAKDVICYTAWGLRRAAIYRQVADLVDDRRTLLRVRKAWQDVCDEALDQPLNVLEEQMLRGTDDAVAGLALEPAKAEQVRQCARQHAACVAQMSATNTAEILRRAERQTNNEQTRNLLRDIVEAADWACIAHADKGSIGVTQFKAAWEELAQNREPAQATALK
jgi:hypothetical protein